MSFWSNAVQRLRQITRGPAFDDEARYAAGLEEAEQQLQAAQSMLAAERRKMLQIREASFDSASSDAAIEHQAAIVASARHNVEAAEDMVHIMSERKQRAEMNAAIMRRQRSQAAYQAEIEQFTADLERFSAHREGMVAAHRSAADRLPRIRQLATALGIEDLPPLWNATRLIRVAELDMVRQEPRFWRYNHLSLANETPSLLEQHRAAVADALPPDPTPRPIAA